MIKAIIKPALVTTIFIIGVWVSLWLKAYSNLSEVSFMAFVTISMIFSIIIPNLNNLKSFSLTNAELVLQDMKETEASVNTVASAICIAVEAIRENSLELNEPSQEYKEAIQKLKTLSNKTT